jgi:hypothetical protein
VYYKSGRRAEGRVLYSLAEAPFRMNCSVCQRSDLEITLHKCPICFKLVCEDCAKREYGRTFCSANCAQQFFFGDDED